MKIIANILILFIGLFQSSFAHKHPYDKTIEIAIVPSFSTFDYSYYKLVKEHQIPSNYDLKLAPMQTVNLGLGIQIYLWDDWQATAHFNLSGAGGGIKSKFLKNRKSILLNSSVANGIDIYQFSLNTEKKIWHSHSAYRSTAPFSFATFLLLGVGINWTSSGSYLLKYTNDVLNHYDYDYDYHAELINYYTGTISLGISNQIFLTNKQSLKLGLLYTYGFQPFEKAKYDFHYTDSHGKQNKDEVLLYTGQHRLLFYATYPITLYRHKVKKKYY